MPSLKEVHQQFFEARIAREQQRKKKAEEFFDDLEREDATELRLFPLPQTQKGEAGSVAVVVPPVDPAATLPAPAAPVIGQEALPAPEAPKGFVMGPDGKAQPA